MAECAGGSNNDDRNREIVDVLPGLGLGAPVPASGLGRSSGSGRLHADSIRIIIEVHDVIAGPLSQSTGGGFMATAFATVLSPGADSISADITVWDSTLRPFGAPTREGGGPLTVSASRIKFTPPPGPWIYSFLTVTATKAGRSETVTQSIFYNYETGETEVIPGGIGVPV